MAPEKWHKQLSKIMTDSLHPLNIAWGGLIMHTTDIMFQSSSISTWWVSGSITPSEGSGALSFVGHACLQFRIRG